MSPPQDPRGALILVGFAALVVLGQLHWMRERARVRGYKARFQVERDDDGVRVTDPQGEVSRLRWSELAEVAIQVHRVRRLRKDFWLQLKDRTGAGVTLPLETPGGSLLLAWAASRDGFDDAQRRAALDSWFGGTFVCWRARGWPGTVQ